MKKKLISKIQNDPNDMLDKEKSFFDTISMTWVVDWDDKLVKWFKKLFK
jgi:hypothetical protein